MKIIRVIPYFVLLIFFASCNEKEKKPSNEKKLSKSYTELKQYLTEAKIDNAENIYFYEDKPRMPMPNVFCFDGNGVQLNTPPGCFSVIKDYIVLLGDSVIPAKLDGQRLDKFLDSIHIMDAYDVRVKFDEIPGRFDYYLFMDYIALPDPAFQEILFNAFKYSHESKKKIKLFLVHAISEKNRKIFSHKSDTINASKIQDSLLR